MALDFPASPSLNQVYTLGTKSWVWNGSGWEAQRPYGIYGVFNINTLSSAAGAGGGSATFNGTAYRFTLSHPPASAQQLIVSLNGVVQKPNAGTSQPAEGFAIDGADILFSDPPATSAPFFIVTIGTTVNIGEPSDNSVTSAKLSDNSVTSAKIVDGTIVDADINGSAAIAGSKISPDFGSQNLTTTGTSTAASFIPTSSTIPTNGVYLPGANSLGLSTNGALRATVDSSGRLLVGTSTSRSWAGISSQTQVEGAATFVSQSIVANSADTVGGLFTLGKSRGTALGSHTVVQSGDILGRIYFVGADGSALIQGATITAEVDGTPGANDMPGRIVLATTADGASSPTERMRISSNGAVLITNGNLNVHTNLSNYNGLVIRNDGSPGSVYYALFVNSGGNIAGSIQHSGSTSVSYNTSSDYRLKENVVAVVDGITRLQQLKPSRFNFIEDPDKTVDGFIAHEVQNVVPEAICGEKDAVDADGKPVYQGIDQSKLVPLLTAALQEAVAKIESLEARLTAAGI